MNSYLDLNEGMEVPNSAPREPTHDTPSGFRVHAERARLVPSPAQAAAVSNDSAPLQTIEELSHHSRLSIATLRRLKRAGRIPYFQPAGKGGRLLFPADAIERAGNEVEEAAGEAPNQAVDGQRLSGPRPAWMR